MALFLNETEVRSLLTMPLALEAVESAFQGLADGSANVHPRQRLHLKGYSYLHYLAATDGAGGYMGLKIYSSSREGLRFVLPLFSAKTGDLLALLEADYLGQMRTGAASGLATKLLARPDAHSVGMIGTGLQARTQLEAVVAVRAIERVRVFGRDARRRELFAREMTARLGVTIDAVPSAREAVRGAAILITATTATDPVVAGEWLERGMHINAIGANFPHKRELDREAVERAGTIFVDLLEQSKMEAGDLILSFEETPAAWQRVKELADLVGRRTGGRTSNEEITLFKSNGIAIEDVVTAGRIYELALERGIGKQLPFWGQGAARGRKGKSGFRPM